MAETGASGALAEYRRRHPQYDGVDDATLADALYRRFYADRLPREEFDRRLRGTTAPQAPTGPLTDLGAQIGEDASSRAPVASPAPLQRGATMVAGPGQSQGERPAIERQPLAPPTGMPERAPGSAMRPQTPPSQLMVSTAPSESRIPVSVQAAQGPGGEPTPAAAQATAMTDRDRLIQLRKVKALVDRQAAGETLSADEQQALTAARTEARLRSGANTPGDAGSGSTGAHSASQGHSQPGASVPELERAPRAAHAAGDTATAQRLAKAVRAAQSAEGQSTIAGAIDSFTDGTAFGFGDNLTAAESAGLRAVGRALEPFGLGFTRHPISGDELLPYDEALVRERAQNDRFAEENPVIDTTASIAGAVGGGFGAMRAGATMMRGGSVGRQAVTGGLEAAAYGAAHGAGAADGVDVGDAAKSGATIGALIGGPMAGGTAALANALMRGAAVKAAPSAQQLKAQADALYSGARAKNPQFEGFMAFADDLATTMQREGYRKSTAPKVAAAMREAQRMRGTVPDFNDMEALRKLAANAAMSSDGAEQRLGKMLRHQIDDYMQRVAPIPEVAQGRAAYARFKKAEQIEDATVRAERRAAASGTGGNAVNAMRQNVRAILDSPRKRAGYSKTELDAMDAFVRGSRSENTMRLLSRLSPTSGGLPLIASIAGAVHDPAFLLASGLGVAGKMGAERAATNHAALVSALVRGAPPPKPLSPHMAALVKALTATTPGSLAGRLE